MSGSVLWGEAVREEMARDLLTSHSRGCHSRCPAGHPALAAAQSHSASHADRRPTELRAHLTSHGLALAGLPCSACASDHLATLYNLYVGQLAWRPLGRLAVMGETHWCVGCGVGQGTDQGCGTEQSQEQLKPHVHSDG